MIGSFALLGIFPLSGQEIRRIGQDAPGLRKLVTKPRHFDYNLVVIGAGAAGLVSAYIAAAVKAKVTLIETAQDGRRLPEHRLRAQQGPDPRRPSCSLHAPTRGSSVSRRPRSMLTSPR